jgi:hypothetical protein
VTFVHLNFFRDAAPVKKVSLFRNGMSKVSHQNELVLMSTSNRGAVPGHQATSYYRRPF